MSTNESPPVMRFVELLEHLEDLAALCQHDEYMAFAAILQYAREIMQRAPEIYGHRGPIESIPLEPLLRRARPQYPGDEEPFMPAPPARRE